MPQGKKKSGVITIQEYSSSAPPLQSEQQRGAEAKAKAKKPHHLAQKRRHTLSSPALAFPRRRKKSITRFAAPELPA